MVHVVRSCTSISIFGSNLSFCFKHMHDAFAARYNYYVSTLYEFKNLENPQCDVHVKVLAIPLDYKA